MSYGIYRAAGANPAIGTNGISVVGGGTGGTGGTGSNGGGTGNSGNLF